METLHFIPNLNDKLTLINFATTVDGLQDQFLSLIILQEKKTLEEERQDLILEVKPKFLVAMFDEVKVRSRYGFQNGCIVYDTAKNHNVLNLANFLIEYLQNSICTQR